MDVDFDGWIQWRASENMQSFQGCISQTYCSPSQRAKSEITKILESNLCDDAASGSAQHGQTAQT